MEKPFYAQGLRFACTRCSACCRGGPGYVFLSSSDLHALLVFLSLDFPQFFHNYCTVVDTGMGMALSLAEKPNYDCVFWEKDGCSVYGARPVQCSTYPFWASILESQRSWLDERAACPGIGAGDLVNASSIEKQLYLRRSAGTIVFPYGADPETYDVDTILGR